MELDEAIELIRFQSSASGKQLWAEPGCGNGLFTKALASLLPKGSIIQAIDRDEKALGKIPADISGVIIKKSVSDFLSEDVFFPGWTEY